MIKTHCPACNTINYRSPSKVQPRNYCSRGCYSIDRNKELKKRGKKSQFKKGNKRPNDWTIRQTKKVSGNKNYAWKGESVSYRGLHQWIRRQKGKPTQCSLCGKESSKPREIQWANIDGKYRRNINDFVAMCCSCHKKHDISLIESSQDFPSAIL